MLGVISEETLACFPVVPLNFEHSQTLLFVRLGALAVIRQPRLLEAPIRSDANPNGMAPEQPVVSKVSLRVARLMDFHAVRRESASSAEMTFPSDHSELWMPSSWHSVRLATHLAEQGERPQCGDPGCQ